MQLIKSEVEIKNKVESRILNELEVKVLRGSEPGDEIRDEFLQDEIVDKLEDVIVKFVQSECFQSLKKSFQSI